MYIRMYIHTFVYFFNLQRIALPLVIPDKDVVHIYRYKQKMIINTPTTGCVAFLMLLTEEFQKMSMCKGLHLKRLYM